jgi:hypothetical protein
VRLKFLLSPEADDIAMMQQQLGVAPQLTIPPYGATPLSEYAGIPTLSLAFPTLYPHGVGDFVDARLR